jgi:DNA-binding LytR/AlgR family response regulator
MSDIGLRLLATDHDQPQLDGLIGLLRDSARVSDVEVAGSAHEALLRASRRRFDAVFLEVRMPELDGLEIASVLKAFALPPAVVFVATSDRHVASAFRLGAIDYLIRPLARGRVEEALDRVQAAIAQRGSTGDGRPATNGAADGPIDGNMLVVNSGRETRVLVPRSILYLESYGDYMRIFADNGHYLVRGRLAEAAVRLAAEGFHRVHRKYLANLHRAIEVETLGNGTAVLRLEDDSQIPVARRHVRELRQRLRNELHPTNPSRRETLQVCGA